MPVMFVLQNLNSSKNATELQQRLIGAFFMSNRLQYDHIKTVQSHADFTLARICCSDAMAELQQFSLTLFDI